MVSPLTCQRPKDLGYAQELWTTRLLAKPARDNCKAAGYPSLTHLARGTVSKILAQSKIRPHKISYYLEQRDPEFETKMAQVLHVYKKGGTIAQERSPESRRVNSPSFLR